MATSYGQQSLLAKSEKKTNEENKRKKDEKIKSTDKANKQPSSLALAKLWHVNEN